ncbi:quinolinate synthase NadA [Pseudodesulfovibrio tunisiensis]|uniref:quinolinate synthase NadA n=1 Tax=Pseudodesulfovibrio tunisiensis TaxID=463192 RepID=UPI001FB32DA1|nr:quinolinate synthase NadA [Pseudodesulfovibrio tunisiensis]
MPNHDDIIAEIRNQRGSSLAILGHHYQSDAVIAHTDIRGDSLELARKINGLDAEYIVFCGVYFMAESAAILRRSGQKILIPDTSASCPMADMANAANAETVLSILNSAEQRIIPLTYVNSSAAVKAVVGRFNGSVCTSANAQTMMKWALAQGDGVLFLPDRHLAVNTANALGVAEDERVILNDNVIHGDPALYVDASLARGKRLIVWPGFCPIHEEFTVADVARIRQTDPDAKIVVHPECPPDVVSASDGNGSTSYLIRFAEKAPEGAIIYMGTEENLVRRLAAEHAGRKTIIPLKASQCEDMGKITLEKLAAQLQSLDQAEPVDVPDDVREPARAALERMLEVCS